MLIRHSFLYIAARIAPGLLGMGTTAILTRLLEPRSYGLYGLALVIMTFVSSTGFDWLGVTFVRFNESRRDDERTAATFILIFFILVGVSAVLAAAAWAAGAFSGAGAPICLLGVLSAWSYSWFEFSARVETSNMRPLRYLVMSFARAAFIMAGASTAAWLTRDPVWTTAGSALGMLAGGMFGSLRSNRVRLALFDRALARTIVGFGLPLAASMTLSTVVVSGVRLLIQVLDSSDALGLYTAAFVLVQSSLAILVSGVASASYPLAVRAVESGDPARAQRQLLANGGLVLAVLAPACLGMALTARGISTTLVGPRFSAGVAALTPWMAAGTFFAGFRAHFLDHAFQLGRRPSLQIWVTCGAAVVAVALGFYLIPRDGPVGAAMAVTGAMLVGCIHAILVRRWAYPVPLPVKAAFQVGFCCLVMTAAVKALPDRHGAAAFLLQVLTGVVAYGLGGIAVDLLGSRRRLLQILAGGRPAALGRPVPVRSVDR